MKGNSPNFMAILKDSRALLKDMIEVRYKVDPVAWIRKYFITPSPVIGLRENSGRNPNNESSKPTQVKNQLLLLATIKIDSLIIDRYNRWDG